MSAYRDDSHELAEGIRDRIEEVLSKYWSGWITSIDRGKRIALVTPRIKEKGKKPTSSFKVTLDGADRGKWYRFSQHVGGYGLQLLFYGEFGRLAVSTEDWAQCYRKAREFLGFSREQPAPPEQEQERSAQRAAQDVERAERHAIEAAEEEKRREARIESAAEVWAGTVPIVGTHGDAYLIARGIAPVAEWPWDPTESIRFHPGLVSELDRGAGRFPAVICRVVDAFGDFLAVWQIYLDRKEPIKARLENAKVGRGPAGGGAVRIGGDGPDISVAEGVETALAGWELDRYVRPSWALLSTSGMMSFEPPVFIKRVRTWPDGDRGKINPKQRTILDPAGMSAALALQKRLIAIGIPNPINEMTRHGDALNLLVSRKQFEGSLTPP